MATIPEALALAIEHHQAGSLREAEQIYQQILEVAPDHADAWHLLGVIHAQRGDHDQGVRCIQRALEFIPHSAEAHSNLGNAWQNLERLEEAIGCYQRALQLNPNFAAAHNNLGNALASEGRLSEAIACYEQALQLKPDYAEAHHQLGTALKNRGQVAEAIGCYRRALQVRPNFAEAHNALGNAWVEQGRLAEAAACYQNAVQVKPNYAEAYSNLGNVLSELGRFAEAIAYYRRALELKPDYVEAHFNLGIAWRDQGELEEAIACYERALQLNPDYAHAHNNLGNVLREQGRIDEAVACFERVLRVRPDDAEAHKNLGIAWLISGKFEQGWPEYEWRWRCKDLELPPFQQPLWDGSPLAGRTILLLGEQGLGDTLQFVRYAPLVKERGCRVLLVCPGPLTRILARCAGIDQLNPPEPLPPYDVYAPLLSLPGILGTSLAAVPAQVPYLFADPDLIEHWRGELSRFGKFKIGIAWQGNPDFKLDRDRSIPLANFSPLAGLEGVQLISLQKGPGTDQLANFAGRPAVVELGSRLDEASGPFMDTAAVMINLDLVITSDTSIAHLAGGLGVPVWVALPFLPDWRWMLKRVDNPWYPTMRLFRQSERGNWGGVFERIARELSALIDEAKGGGAAPSEAAVAGELRTGEFRAGAAQTRSLLIEVAPGELIDKITILQIKSERIADAEKLSNIRTELTTLLAAREQSLAASTQLAALTADLKAVNEMLWQIEDEIRVCERNGDFGPRFVELARSVYRQNDRRAALKREINVLLGSKLVEEKSYTSYK